MQPNERGVVLGVLGVILSKLLTKCRVAIAISIPISLAIGFGIGQRVSDPGALDTTALPAIVSTSASAAPGRCYENVDRWEREYGVPANIQRAIIKMESGGKWRATSTTRPIDGEPRQAVGCFQVVAHWNRFAAHEDPYDPDTNARVGLGFLLGCNNRAAGHGQNWTDADIVLRTAYCYHAGPHGNWSAPAVQRYGLNVLALSGITGDRA